jgi:hypothetical protein
MAGPESSFGEDRVRALRPQVRGISAQEPPHRRISKKKKMAPTEAAGTISAEMARVIGGTGARHLATARGLASLVADVYGGLHDSKI